MSAKENLVDKIVSRETPYVIAEIGINHNGDMQLAREMIDAAAENGASCVKFQNFIVDKYISSMAGKADYQKQDQFLDQTQNEIIKKCEITIQQAEDLNTYAKKKNIDFLSTPFEVWSLRGLLEIGMQAIKVSSCNLTNLQFLEELSVSGVPVLISTGMASFEEVIQAVNIFKTSQSPIILFQCTSNYPSDPKNANLKVIETYKNLFNVPIGLSDHTKSNTTSIAAVALGAVVIEKHFTLSRDLPGIDQNASMEPHELRELVSQLKECKLALGSSMKFRTSEEENTAIALRRSLVAAKDITAGDLITENNLIIMRPGNGLPPSYLPKLLGKRLTKSIKKGMPLNLEDFLQN